MSIESCPEGGGVNEQSNMKLTRFKPNKTVGSYMSGLKLDMSDFGSDMPGLTGSRTAEK
jgi:hypothetical protein